MLGTWAGREDRFRDRVLDGQAFEFDGGVVAICGCERAQAILYKRVLLYALVNLRVKLEESLSNAIEAGGVSEHSGSP